MKHELPCWPRGQSCSGSDGRGVTQHKIEAAYKLSNDQYRLRLSEASANTRVWPCSKGNISLLPIIRSLPRNKALRHESARPLPVVLVPVKRPRRDHHQSTPLYSARPNLAIRHGDPRYKGDRRIQPKGFTKEGSYPGQLFYVLKLDGAFSNDLPYFSSQSGHPVRLDRQKIENPGQCARRGFMAGEKKDAELVDQFFASEGLPGIRISRSNDIACNIVEIRRTDQMRINEIPQMRSDASAGRYNRIRLCHLRPSLLKNQTKNVYLSDRPFKLGKVIKDLTGYTRLKRRREGCSTNNVRSEVAHRKIQRKGLAGICAGVENRRVVRHRFFHSGEGMINPHVTEGRVNHCTLPTPLVAIGNKDRFSNKRLEGIDHQITFRKRTAVIPQDKPDQFGVIEKHRSSSRVTKIAHVKTIGSSGQEIQQIAIPIAQNPKQCGQSGQWPRVWWDEGRARTHVCFPDDRKAKYGRLI